MKTRRNLPWARITAESAVIIASILLAFAIDAWWDGRQQKAQEQVMLEGLLADFEASQQLVDRYLDGNQRSQRALQIFRDLLVKAAPGAEIEVLQEWLVAAIGAPTYDPVDATLRAAQSSGQVELIRDPTLRRALADWRQKLDDTREDEVLIRTLVVTQLVPELSKQVRLGKAFEFVTVLAVFEGRGLPSSQPAATLLATPELEAVVTERLFYTTFVVEGLRDVRASQAAIIERLRNDLGLN